jgi:hypothetical protein
MDKLYQSSLEDCSYEVSFYVCREVRECLRLDPEHNDCFPHYKVVKKVDKFLIDAQEDINNKDYQHCIDSADKVRVIFVCSEFHGT